MYIYGINFVGNLFKKSFLFCVVMICGCCCCYCDIL